MLTKEQFEILSIAAQADAPLSGAGTDTIRQLQLDGFISNGKITESGLAALEPYRVKRAIFIAAGMGSRMMPITLSCPKPLVRVNGTRIIDTLIDACIDVGIEDIIIVRGYLGECFEQLKIKYPFIKFVDNPYYKSYNNISSAYLVRNLIGGSYIFESDIYLINKKLITKYQYRSNYLGVPCEETPDWCFDADENMKITDLHKGGKNCFHMYGISYYDEETGKLFCKCVEEIFNTRSAEKTTSGMMFCAISTPKSQTYMFASAHSAILLKSTHLTSCVKLTKAIKQKIEVLRKSRHQSRGFSLCVLIIFRSMSLSAGQKA